MKPREIPIGSDIERMSDSARANSPGACVSERCNYNGLTARNVEDCLDVIETMKHVHPSSVPLIHRIVALFLALGPLDSVMLQEALCGSTLTETAIYMGTSKQSAHQRWGRLAEAFPELEKVYRKRRRIK